MVAYTTQEVATSQSFVEFFKGEVRKAHDFWSDKVLPAGLENLFRYLNGSTDVSDDHTIYIPELFSWELTATMCIESHFLGINIHYAHRIT